MQPNCVISLVFSCFLFLVQTQSFAASTSLPGFSSDSLSGSLFRPPLNSLSNSLPRSPVSQRDNANQFGNVSRSSNSGQFGGPSSSSNVNPTIAKQTQLISLDFQNIGVRDLLRLLANFSQQNIVISERIMGKMSIKLHHVTWREALEVVLRMQGLQQQEENSTLFIVPNGDVEKYAKYPNAQSSLSASSIPSVLALKHTQAEDIAAILARQNALLANGNVSVDKQDNSLLISAATTPQMAALQQVAHTLDVPTKQVVIEGQIVVADDKVVDELGLKFGTVISNDSNTNGSGVTAAGGVSMDLPSLSLSPGHFGMTIAKLGDGALLNMELAALESVGHVKIISSPKIITGNNQAAYIESGQEIPYQEKTSSGATNVAFKKAVLSLKVTPSIISQDKVILNLHLNQDKVSDIAVNGVPAIQTQQMQTQVTLKSGETVILGGIYEYTTIENNVRVPLLGAIPVLGYLFRSKHLETTRKELLILITPQIYS